MNLLKTKNNKGFVILFAVTLAAIMLSIALGVSSIAQNEVKFGTSARETNDALFAADAGVECALLHDKSAVAQNAFTGTAGNMTCGGNTFVPVESPVDLWTFAIPSLGSLGDSCARVTVDKTALPITTIISKGFNTGNGACTNTPVRQVERELHVSYSTGPILGSFLVDSGGTLVSNLVAYWKLDEASGSRSDSFGGNNLVNNNAVGQAAGKQGNAGQFNTANSRYLSRASNSTLQTGDISFTIAAWVKADSLPTSVIVSKRDSTILREWTLTYVPSAFRFNTFDAAGNSAGLVLANTPVPIIGTWYFLVAWRDKTSGTVNIQVNNGTIYTVAETTAPTLTNAGFKIGAFAEPASTFWDGAIDEVGFWKRVLTGPERADLYNAGNGNTYNP
jgi:hypothetical protein